MHSANSNPLDVKHRFFYGAVVGAILGMIIGTMPGLDPILGLISMLIGGATLGVLAAISKNFWESLLAAWELVRMAFWRW
jgi:F0F1-type ATP synthase assembly protein I